MTVCLLVIDDGREDFRERCWEAVTENLTGWTELVEVDDSRHLLGAAGAVREGWRQVLETGAEWVFHLESDFLLLEPVPLERMIAVLRRHPHLTQLALKRQPWNKRERRAGGIVEQDPGQFHEVRESGDVWTETRWWRFTLNPSVYSTALCRRSYPNPPRAEERFNYELARDYPWMKSAYWGGKFDPPRVEHIGERRAGHGY